MVAQRQGVVRSAFGVPQHNPLKAPRPLSCSRLPSFGLLSPFGKGDFRHAGAAARLSPFSLPQPVNILSFIAPFRLGRLLYRPWICFLPGCSDAGGTFVPKERWYAAPAQPPSNDERDGLKTNLAKERA